MDNTEYKWRGIYIRTRRAKKRIILADLQETLAKADKYFRQINPYFQGQIFEEVFIPAITETHSTEDILDHKYTIPKSAISGIAFFKYKTEIENDLLRTFRECYIKTYEQPQAQMKMIIKNYQEKMKKHQVCDLKIDDMIEIDDMVGCIKSIDDDMITVKINSTLGMMDYVTHISNIQKKI